MPVPALPWPRATWTTERDAAATAAASAWSSAWKTFCAGCAMRLSFSPDILRARRFRVHRSFGEVLVGKAARPRALPAVPGALDLPVQAGGRGLTWTTGVTTLHLTYASALSVPLPQVAGATCKDIYDP